MKYPTICILIFLISGIITAAYFREDLLYTFLIASLIAFFVMFFFHRKWQIAILPVVFFFGAISYTSSTQSSLSEFENRYVNLVGVVCEIPSQSLDNYSYVLKCSELVYNNTSYPINEKIHLTSPDFYEYNSKLSVYGFLSPITPNTSMGKFNFKLYYMVHDISYTLFSGVGKSEYIGNINTPYSIYDIANRFRLMIINIAFENYSIDSAAILTAVLTGKSNFSASLKEKLLNTGTYRYLHSPFIFMSVISHICIFFFNKFNVTYYKRNIIFFMIILLIMSTNQHSSTFVKTSVVFICYQICLMRYGFIHVPEILPIAIFIILLFNPLYIFDIPFVMSISSTTLNFMFKTYFLNKLHFIKYPFLRNTIVIWIINNILMLPIIAFFFDGISLYTFITIFTLPYIALIITIISPILLPISNIDFFKYILDFLLYLIDAVADFISALPFSYISLPSPSVLELTIWLCGILIFKYYITKNIKSNASVILITAMITLYTLFAFDKLYNINTLKIDFVNVGQGDASVISLPFRETIIIDGGGSSTISNYNVGDNIFLPYLEHHGFTKIDLIIVSHYHKDHVEGVISAIKSADIRCILMPDCDPNNIYRNQIELLAKEKNISVLYSKPGMNITFKSGLNIRILAPDFIGNNLAEDDLNYSSIIAEVNYGDFSALYTGDAPALIEKQLVKYNRLKHYNLLKIAHHGSLSSSCDEFLDAVSPDYAVISVGKNNLFGHPSEEVLNSLAERNIPTLRTDKLNDIHIEVTKSGIKKLRHYKGGN